MAELAKKIHIYPSKVVNVESEEKWVQPVLTSNSSIGSNGSFGVSCNSYSTNSSSASGDIYKAFDSDKTGTYWRSGTSTGWFSFYNSIPLKVKNIEITPYYSYPMTGTIEVSSDGTTWSKIKDWTNTDNATFTIEVNSDNYYKYYKVNITKISRDVIHLCNIGIDAVTKKVTQESNSSAKLYTTINEVGSEYIMSNIDGITCYTPLGSNSDIRATNGKVLKNNKVYSILRTGKPPYTEKSWTTAGTYTFTVPAGVTRIRVAVCGGGGGGIAADGGSNGTNGGTSKFGSLIQATGGTGGLDNSYWNGTEDFLDDSIPGVGGTPNGRNGKDATSNAGGVGFSLSFQMSNGTYGHGGDGCSRSYSIGTGGGSGGYDSNYVNVEPAKTYTVVVGEAGRTIGDGIIETSTSGFVLIAFGGDI